MAEPSEPPGTKDRPDLADDLVSDLSMKAGLDPAAASGGGEGAPARPEPPLPEAGTVPIDDHPTMIVRADKALARAREMRALRLQLGSTFLVERDAQADAARAAARRTARKELLINVAAGLALLMLGVVLFLGVQWYRAKPGTSGVEIEETPLAEEAPPPPTKAAETQKPAEAKRPVETPEQAEKRQAEAIRGLGGPEPSPDPVKEAAPESPKPHSAAKAVEGAKGTRKPPRRGATKSKP